MQAGLGLIFKVPLKLRLVKHAYVVVLVGSAGEASLPQGVFFKSGCVVVCDSELRRICAELVNAVKGVKWMHSK